MSEADIQIILHRLDELGRQLSAIHTQVRETNGRVTDLEFENERLKGFSEGRRIHGMIAASVVSGGILAGIIWFVSTAI